MSKSRLCRDATQFAMCGCTKQSSTFPNATSNSTWAPQQHHYQRHISNVDTRTIKNYSYYLQTQWKSHQWTELQWDSFLRHNGYCTNGIRLDYTTIIDLWGDHQIDVFGQIDKIMC